MRSPLKEWVYCKSLAEDVQTIRALGLRGMDFISAVPGGHVPVYLGAFRWQPGQYVKVPARVFADAIFKRPWAKEVDYQEFVQAASALGEHLRVAAMAEVGAELEAAKARIAELEGIRHPVDRHSGNLGPPKRRPRPVSSPPKRRKRPASVRPKPEPESVAAEAEPVPVDASQGEA